MHVYHDKQYVQFDIIINPRPDGPLDFQPPDGGGALESPPISAPKPRAKNHEETTAVIFRSG